jgi:hypothetical protein
MGQQPTYSERVSERADTLAALGVNALEVLYDLTATFDAVRGYAKAKSP